MNRKSYILLGLAVLLCIGEACAEKPHPVNAPTQSIKEVQQKKENPQNPKKGKPRIQTSARPENTVYKPVVEKAKAGPQKKAPAQTAVKQTKKNNTTKVSPKPTKAEAKNKNKRPNSTNKKNTNKKNTKSASKATNRYIALKANVPFLAVVVPNIALEVQLHKHISLDFPVMWSISDIEREHALRAIAFQPEGRWWLNSVGDGHFFGIHAHIAWFNMKWENNRYQTEKRPLAGVGISYGYKLPLSAHWGAEFNIGAGYANMKYNSFYNIENGAKLDTRIKHYWGITRVGLSLVYRF